MVKYTKVGQRTKRINRKVSDPVFNQQFFAIWGNDIKQASIDLHTHQVTIKRWLNTGCNNECARLYINLLYRGGIPDRDGWQDWRFVGDKLISPEGCSYRNKDLNRWTIEKPHYAQLCALEKELTITGLLKPIKSVLRSAQLQIEDKDKGETLPYLDI